MKNAGKLPRKGDRVTETRWSETGTINSVSRGYAYVDYGRGSFEPIPVSHLVADGERRWRLK